MPHEVAWRILILRAYGRRGELVWARPDEREQAHDRDIIDRWAEAEGVDMEGEAERAREKLRTVDRAREETTDDMGTPRVFPSFLVPGSPLYTSTVRS